MVSHIKKIVIQLALAIKNNEFTGIQNDIKILDVHDLLDLFSLSSDKAKLLVFRLLDPEVAADLFAELSPQSQNDLLKHFTDKEVIRILEELEPDERTAVFEQIPGKATQRLLNLLSKEELLEAKQLLGYPEESI
jgi:magnesium transporter